MMDIGMSELINSNIVGMNGERNLLTVSEALRTSSSDTRCDNKSLHDEGMFFWVGLGPSHQECSSSDVRGWHVKFHRVRAAAMALHLMSVLIFLAKCRSILG